MDLIKEPDSNKIPVPLLMSIRGKGKREGGGTMTMFSHELTSKAS